MHNKCKATRQCSSCAYRQTYHLILGTKIVLRKLKNEVSNNTAKLHTQLKPTLIMFSFLKFLEHMSYIEKLEP